ncbi:hypothetical protein [Sagittula sp. SSi028]|uniref:hypothetical protein n=1 Tax=Sagittula sp. SSi028 TaxID=3400636 RepID=UPI003AF65C85
MARPRKPPHTRRTRWDALYASADERAEITAAAQKADRSVSRYLITLHETRTARPASRDTSELTFAYLRARQQLAVLDEEIRKTHPQATDILNRLTSIERHFLREAAPWALANDQDPPC